MLLASAALLAASAGAEAQSRFYARQTLQRTAASPAQTQPPAAQPTSCGAFVQNRLPPTDATYLRAARGATLDERLADAKTACQGAQATVCGYNDSSPAQGGGYTIYVSTAKGATSRFVRGTVYWAAECS